jgi:predicted nucleic acid-binding Zn ribbon protein
MVAPGTIDLVCDVCGILFRADRKGRRRHFCGRECQLIATMRRTRRYRGERRYERSLCCTVCNAAFKTISYETKTCSESCARELRQRERIRGRHAGMAMADLFDGSP